MLKRRVLLCKDLIFLPRFLYPSFLFVEEVPKEVSGVRGIILNYPGGTDSIEKIEKLEALGVNWVFVTSSRLVGVDRNLSSNSKIFSYLVESGRIKGNKVIQEKVEKLTDLEFLRLVKISLVLGRWDFTFFRKRVKTYKIFQSLLESRKDFLEVYFSIREERSAEEIFSSSLTYLEKTENFLYMEDNLSKFYRKMLKRGEMQNFDFREKLLKMSGIKDVPSDLFYLYFFLNLRR